MSIAQLLQIIQTLPQDKQEKLRELYQLIDKLYQHYGNKIAQDPILQTIRHDNADLADLIVQTNQTVGLAAIHHIVPELEKICQPHIVEITAQDASVVEPQLKAKYNDSKIYVHQDNIIGVKIQSSEGKRYERTLDKDITKLTR